MAFHVQLFIQDAGVKTQVTQWLQNAEFKNFKVQIDQPLSPNDIVVFEITTLFDWIRIKRIKKHYQGIIIFPILNDSLLKTAPIAFSLKLPTLFTKPLRKKEFLRHFKKILSVHSDYDVVDTENNFSGESFRDIFWRRVLKGEIKESAEVVRAFSIMSSTMVPNLVCVIQGFVKDPDREKKEGWEASAVVQKAFLEAMKEIGQEAYFVPFHKHAALMLKVPSEIATPSFWKEGKEAMFKAIQHVKEKYGIHLYMGVGSISREILRIKESYENAKIARVTVAKHQLSLRYFDEIPTNISVQKSVDYIRARFTQDLSMNEVAATINFSPTYFSRLFKKETGHSFVSYLTLVRLLRSIWLLRQSDQTIEQIALDLGFNTPNYFSSTFKKEIGLSPSQYRATKEILFSHNWVEDDF